MCIISIMQCPGRACLQALKLLKSCHCVSALKVLKFTALSSLQGISLFQELRHSYKLLFSSSLFFVCTDSYVQVGKSTLDQKFHCSMNCHVKEFVGSEFHLLSHYVQNIS
jgi:hypothetical protein